MKFYGRYNNPVCRAPHIGLARYLKLSNVFFLKLSYQNSKRTLPNFECEQYIIKLNFLYTISVEKFEEI